MAPSTHKPHCATLRHGRRRARCRCATSVRVCACGVADGPGRRYEGGRVHWHNLAEQGLETALNAIIALISTEAIWFSIDKDVLPEADALTNWDQGQMPLSAVVEVMRALGARKRIAGADICGEYSTPRTPQPVQALGSAHGSAAGIGPDHIGLDPDLLARNENTNRQLLIVIERAARR